MSLLRDTISHPCISTVCVMLVQKMKDIKNCCKRGHLKVKLGDLICCNNNKMYRKRHVNVCSVVMSLGYFLK